MRSRKVKDLESALLKKGFSKLDGKQKNHHQFFYLTIDGKKSHINTYLSHGAKSQDYSSSLMTKIKRQLKFTDADQAEQFFDCPMTGAQYVEMLRNSGEIE